MNAPRRNRVDVHGWIVLDKPVGMTSTHAVAAVRRLFNAKKAGHAGTLDPLASGILPLAFGEATKTVPYVVDGEKAYTLHREWGDETDTDDTEGKVVATSDIGPTRGRIRPRCPASSATIIAGAAASYSAIKIDGERAYDLARDGEDVRARRPRRRDPCAAPGGTAMTTRATFEAECGKGTYVRAIARDLGRKLGCLGHVTALRRTRVGPFSLDDTVTWQALEEAPRDGAPVASPVEGGLTELPCVVLNRDAAARIRRGQSVILRGRDAPAEGGPLYATCDGVVVAVGMVERGEFVPNRVFNLDF